MNSEVTSTSPRAYSIVEKIAMYSQASSARAKQNFENIGRSEGRELQSTLNSSLEMLEMLSLFVQRQVEDTLMPQIGLLHPLNSVFNI